MSFKENPFSPTYRYAIANRARKAFLRQRLPQMKGVGFNFGASDSNWSELLSPDAKMWCMDIDQEAGNIDLRADIQCVGILTESLDWILCADVIEHVPDFDAALKEISRCLKPGGKLILTVPFSIPLHGEPHDYWRFTEYSLGVLAAKQGLRLVHLESFGNFGAFLWQALAAEYHRRYFWVSAALPRPKGMILKFFSATVPYFCALCYFMASFTQGKDKTHRSGNALGWGACLEKPA